jgi:peptide/nickel transport system permease protein
VSRLTGPLAPGQASEPSTLPAREEAGDVDELTLVSAGDGEATVAGSARRSARTLAVGYAVTVFVLVTANFFLPRALPGDPITSLIDPGGPSYVQNAEVRAELEAYYGLDRPVPEQYVAYLGDLARGDLGVSIRYNRPVGELVAERLPWTVLLVASSLVLATVVGWTAGVHSGWRRGRPVDRGLLSVFLALRSFPVFFLGSIALFVLAVRFDVVPLSGGRTLYAPGMGPLERIGDIAHHLALPAVVLASQFAGGQYMTMRAGMVAELGADYVLGGRAKGLRERRLKYRYAGRNALLPVVTVTTIQLGGAVTASILVETVFAYPGLGRLVFDAISFRDYPALQGCFLFLSLFVVTVNPAGAAATTSPPTPPAPSPPCSSYATTSSPPSSLGCAAPASDANPPTGPPSTAATKRSASTCRTSSPTSPSTPKPHRQHIVDQGRQAPREATRTGRGTAGRSPCPGDR